MRFRTRRGAQADEPQSRRTFRLAGAVSVALAALISTPSAVVLFFLLTPDGPPPQQLPTPNAFDTIVDISISVSSSPFETVESNWDTAPPTALVPALTAIQDDLDRLQNALLQESQMPVHLFHRWDDYGLYAVADLRMLARALSARGRVAALNGDHERACQSYLDVIRLGYSIRRGGLILDMNVGTGTSSIGANELFKHRNTFSAEQCRAAAAVLIELDENVEPIEDVNARERYWTNVANDWYGNLLQMAADLSGDSRATEKAHLETFHHHRTAIRLLAVELALLAYKTETGDYPASLADLVPDYMPKVPSDPFDELGGPLRYRRTDDEYRLYSVGGNRVDGGAPPPDGSLMIYDQAQGDLTLDQYIW